MTIEKLNIITPDLTKQNIARIAELFPECVTEGPKETASDRGEPVVDFDLLRQALSDYLVEGPQERYRLDWPGKRQALLTANTPIDKTLRPVRQDSVDFDSTRNLFIEGDNLDALKLLQETYLGKVKMIYIDPPYNTGRDFIYKDNFAATSREYETGSGQRDATNTRLVANPETNGRFHSDWLSMMYPRLKLARNVLAEDGIIFISIDDNEVSSLIKCCNEIFGEANFIGCAGRVTKKSNNKGEYWAPNFDYILTYTRSETHARAFFGGVNHDAYDQIDDDGPRAGEPYQLVRMYMSSLENRNPEQRFFIECPDGQKVIPPGSTFPPERPKLGDGIWRWTRRKMEECADQVVIKRVKSSNLVTEDGSPARWNVFTKTYLSDVIENSTAKPNSFIESQINQIGSHEMNALGIPFDFAKPSTLIEYLIEVSRSDGDSLILDFFGGSGTTAQAVMSANAADGGSRRWIIVQLDETVDEGREAATRGFRTIPELARERIRRAGAKTLEKTPPGTRRVDVGFRAFHIDSGNFVDTRVTPQQASQDALAGMISHIRDDRSEEDLLFGALLRWGVDISLQVEKRELAGRTIWMVDPPADGNEGATLIACFARPQQGKGGIDTELADGIARMKPLRVLFRDDGFTSDSVMENVQSRFKQLAPDTDVKVL